MYKPGQLHYGISHQAGRVGQGAEKDWHDSLDNLVNWVKDMWQVPAIKEYGLSPEIHLQYRKSSVKTGVPDYDFIIRPAEGLTLEGNKLFPQFLSFEWLRFSQQIP